MMIRFLSFRFLSFPVLHLLVCECDDDVVAVRERQWLLPFLPLVVVVASLDPILLHFHRP
jgi:hypothetical protein